MRSGQVYQAGKLEDKLSPIRQTTPSLSSIPIPNLSDTDTCFSGDTLRALLGGSRASIVAEAVQHCLLASPGQSSSLSWHQDIIQGAIPDLTSPHVCPTLLKTRRRKDAKTQRRTSLNPSKHNTEHTLLHRYHHHRLHPDTPDALHAPSSSMIHPPDTQPGPGPTLPHLSLPRLASQVASSELTYTAFYPQLPNLLHCALATITYVEYQPAIFACGISHFSCIGLGRYPPK